MLASHVWDSVCRVIYLFHRCCFSITDLCVIVYDLLMGSMTWALQGFWMGAQAETEPWIQNNVAPIHGHFSIYLFICLYIFFWIYSSKWERVRSDSPVKRVSRKFGCKWEILQLTASECICFAWSCCCRFCLHKEVEGRLILILLKFGCGVKVLYPFIKLLWCLLVCFLFIHNSSFKRQFG